MQRSPVHRGVGQEFTAFIIASGDVTSVISPFAALCSEVKDINRRLGPKL